MWVMSNKVTKEIVSKAEIEKALKRKQERQGDNSVCFHYARHRALSLKVC